MGHGYLGKWHAQKLSEQSSLVSFIGIVEPNISIHEQIRLSYPHIKIVTQIQDIIDEVDAVIVATPTSMHREHVEVALKNKVHVFCEKPLAHNAESARELDLLAKKFPEVVTQVGHSERCHQVFEKQRSFIHQNFSSGYCKFERYGAFKGRATDVSCVEDIMVHDLDLMLYLFEPELINCYAYGIKSKTQHWDSVVATFMSKTQRFDFFVSRDATEEKRLITCFGSKGSMAIDLMTLKVSKTQNGVEVSEYEKRDHLLYEQSRFFDSILNKKEAFIDFHAGYKACYLVEQVLKSLQINAAVKIDLPQ